MSESSGAGRGNIAAGEALILADRWSRLDPPPPSSRRDRAGDRLPRGVRRPGALARAPARLRRRRSRRDRSPDVRGEASQLREAAEGGGVREAEERAASSEPRRVDDDRDGEDAG